MSDQFCDLVQSTLLPFFPRQHRRADGKLTISEQARLVNSFEATWTLANRLGDHETAPSAEDELNQMKLPDLLRIREVAVFLYTNITQADREEIASAFHRETIAKDAYKYEDARVTKGFSRILSAFTERVVKERRGSYPIPEGAPLDIFSFFDQWQEDVEKCVPL